MGSPYAASLEKGLKVFVIPKNLGNSYFTTADSVKSGGASQPRHPRRRRNGDQRHGRHGRIAAAGDPGRDRQGRQDPGHLGDRPDGALPDVEAGDGEGRHGRHLRLRRADLPRPVREPGLDRGYWRERGRRYSRRKSAPLGGRSRSSSATASATNQNAWISYMHIELKKYPKLAPRQRRSYGNDDPTTATQVTQGLLQKYPKLKGIISPTTVGSPPRHRSLDAAMTAARCPADRSRHAAGDEGLHRRTERSPRSSAAGIPATSDTWRPMRRVDLASKTITNATASPSRPASWGSTPLERTTRSCSARRPSSPKSNVNQFSFYRLTSIGPRAAGGAGGPQFKEAAAGRARG